MIARLIPKGSFGHNASLVAGGTVLAQALGLLAAPLLTRLYSIEDFGNLQIFVSMLGFGLSIVAGRYEQAILLPDSDEKAVSVVVLGLGVVVVTSLGYAIILWLLMAIGFVPVSWQAVQSYLWLVPVSMCGAGTYLVLNYWVIRRRDYKQIAYTKLTQATGQLVSQLVLGGVFATGLIGLIVGDTLGRCSGSLRLMRFFWGSEKARFRAVRWKEIKEVAVRYRAFPLISTSSNFINTLGIGLPVLCIGGFFGPTVLGWFSLVDRLMNVPLAIVGQALAQVYLGEAPKLLHQSRNAFRQLFYRRLMQLALAGFGPFLLAWILAPWLFALVFGASWREAGYYARILIPMNYVAFIVWPLMSTLNLLERQKWQLGWDIGRLVLTVGGLVLAHGLGSFNASGTIAVYSGAMLAGYAAYFILCWRAIASFDGAWTAKITGADQEGAIL